MLSKLFHPNSLHRILLLVIFLFLVMMGIPAILGLHIPAHDPLKYLVDDMTGFKLVNAPISWQLPFGTDGKGYDIFSQIYYGLKTNIIFSLIASLIYVLSGILLGIRLGYYRSDSSDFDRFITSGEQQKVKRFSLESIKRYLVYKRKEEKLGLDLLKVLNSFPILLIIIFISVVLQNNHFIDNKNVQLAITMCIFGIISSPKLTNMIINKIQGLRNEEFIQASIVLGIPNKIIVLKHILWLECRWVILYQFAYMMGQASILEITLKYFKYSVFPPWVSWGTIIINAFSATFSLNMLIPIAIITLTIYFYMGLAQEFKKLGEKIDI